MQKILTRILNFFKWDRINPSILNPQWATYYSLDKAIVDFSNTYVKKWDTILDFGCWKMIYKPFLIKKWIKEYRGIDIGDSPEFTKDYIVYSWGTLPANDSEFDVTFSTQVFEHLDDPVFYWQELERVTRKNGYLFISIAHVWEYHAYPKHYYNVCFDAIPLMFKHSKIIAVTGDTTNLQNSFQMFLWALLKKNFVVWVLASLFINGISYVMNLVWICKVMPVDYQKNSMTWNILITLQVNKA
jgi:SAM-dependent methyltransferase